MADIGSYEAKTHLAQLLERVQHGERFTITKHGKPVAELVPVSGRSAEDVRKAINELRAVRNQLAEHGVGRDNILREGESLKNLTHKGHRY